MIVQILLRLIQQYENFPVLELFFKNFSNKQKRLLVTQFAFAIFAVSVLLMTVLCLVPRERSWRYLRSVEQEERSRVRGGPDPRHPHVRGQGLPARQRVLRLHRRPEVQHRRPGLPPVRVRPLADPSRRPALRRNQAPPDRADHKGKEGPEARQPRPGQLSGQIVITTALLCTVCSLS